MPAPAVGSAAYAAHVAARALWYRQQFLRAQAALNAVTGRVGQKIVADLLADWLIANYVPIIGPFWGHYRLTRRIESFLGRKDLQQFLREKGPFANALRRYMLVALFGANPFGLSSRGIIASFMAHAYFDLTRIQKQHFEVYQGDIGFEGLKHDHVKIHMERGVYQWRARWLREKERIENMRGYYIPHLVGQASLFALRSQNSYWPIDTGESLSGWGFEIARRSVTLTNTAPHAGFVEEGINQPQNRHAARRTLQENEKFIRAYVQEGIDAALEREIHTAGGVGAVALREFAYEYQRTFLRSAFRPGLSRKQQAVRYGQGVASRASSQAFGYSLPTSPAQAAGLAGRAIYHTTFRQRVSREEEQLARLGWGIARGNKATVERYFETKRRQERRKIPLVREYENVQRARQRIQREYRRYNRYRRNNR